jgi:hypothetical protein
LAPYICRPLSNYHQQLVQTEDEFALLRSWLMASKANQDLFDDISTEEKWESDWLGIPHNLVGSTERIRMRMIENQDKAADLRTRQP